MHRNTKPRSKNTNRNPFDQPRHRRTCDKSDVIVMYVESDFQKIKNELPEIIEKAKKAASNSIIPTISERDRVMESIREFLRETGRIVYGGTATDEAIRLANPNDGIYKEYCKGDIEFYSSSPVADLVKLCDKLHAEGFEFIGAREARHKESYTMGVNYYDYCDVTYIPARLERKIQTLTINGVKYVHPHFALIDHLRMINNPLTAADFRWDKQFPRMYKALKYYPIKKKSGNAKIGFKNPPEYASKLFDLILRKYFLSPDANNFLISGLDAYNYYIKQSVDGTSRSTDPQVIKISEHVKTFFSNVPTIEILSVKYIETVKSAYKFIKKICKSTDITLTENAPLFQFTGRSTTINYKNYPVITIFNEEKLCIPKIQTKSGYVYITYQYVLMILLIHKFRSYAMNNPEDVKNYSMAISNLICARNHYINTNRLDIINDSPFGEFKVDCRGQAESFNMEAIIRKQEKFNRGIKAFRYEPAANNINFDPNYMKGKFDNTSGNVLTERNQMFDIRDKTIVVVSRTREVNADMDGDVDAEADGNDNLDEMNRFHGDSSTSEGGEITGTDEASDKSSSNDN